MVAERGEIMLDKLDALFLVFTVWVGFVLLGLLCTAADGVW